MLAARPSEWCAAVPTFNGAEFVAAALASVREQSLTPAPVIIGDAGPRHTQVEDSWSCLGQTITCRLGYFTDLLAHLGVNRSTRRSGATTSTGQRPKV